MLVRKYNVWRKLRPRRERWMPGERKAEPKGKGSKLGEVEVPETVRAGAMDVNRSVTLKVWTGVSDRLGYSN